MNELPFDPDPVGRQHGEEPPPGVTPADRGLTLETLAAAKALEPEFLTSLGVRDGVAGAMRRPCVDIPYTDTRGEVRAVHKRLALDGDVRFIWRRGDRATAYGLSRLPPSGESIVLVEGTSDCWTLWAHGFGALGIPGAGMWRSEYAEFVVGREVWVWQEPGDAGRRFADDVARVLPDVRVIVAPSDAKDPSALYLLDPSKFEQRMRELMASARPARARLDAARQAEADAALVEGRQLLDAPDLIERVERAIVAGGYAGDPTPALLAYAALSSRCLRRPLNLAFVAASASGKNRAIDSALPLVPEDAYILVKAGSARALIYAERDYQQRTVIVAEADSIPEDGPAASAVRALAEDNSMQYDVTERDETTGKFAVRHIEKPGPTSLVTTSTYPLDEQLSTRVLTVAIDDRPEQTRAVLHAHAADVNGTRPRVDVNPFVAVQRWLALDGVKDVYIPFAGVLADMVPVALVRMRRDFRQLLTVIETIAFLHQRQRTRDEQGRIVATMQDYAIARRLLLDTFAAAATGGLNAAVREAAFAVCELHAEKPEGSRVVDVAARLGLHKTTTWYRLRRAIQLGLVVNRETRKGQPALLVPGDATLDEQDVLPSVPLLSSRLDASRPEASRTVEPSAAPVNEPGLESGSIAGSDRGEQPIEPLGASPSGPPAEPVQRFNGEPDDSHAADHLGDDGRVEALWGYCEASAALAEDWASVVAAAARDPMLKAALDTGLVTFDALASTLDDNDGPARAEVAE